MNIAIVQDGLMCRAGGEQVALSFHKAFPNAPIYTLAYDKNNTFQEFKTAKIKTSWIQYISHKDSFVKKIFFPFGLLAAKSIDVRNYDVVLMSTTHCAKYVKTSSTSIIICYSHNPFRLIWYPEEYLNLTNSNGFKGIIFNYIFKHVIKYLRAIDKKSIEKVDYLLTNSTTVLNRLKSVYNNYNKSEITIVHPPVRVQNFHISHQKKDYFLVVSRLEYYKRVDLVIDVFKSLNFPLIIVGKGPLESELKASASRNIQFMKDLNNQELSKVFSEAKALIFPQVEDFGITALEANASGVPVIAFGNGGIKDTQIPFTENTKPFTSVFFKEQTIPALSSAIKEFLNIEDKVDPFFIRKHSENFSEELFIIKIRSFIEEKSRY